MRVSVSWLREYCDPPLSTLEIADALAASGNEYERIDRVGVASTDGYVVGQVLEVEAHPDADRLSVCRVDDGSGEPRTIVCGAPNVAAGQTVAVARPGAVLADGTELGEAKLRGVVSSGMILAEDEVGLGPDHEGIMVLDGGAAPGAPLADHLPIADKVIDIEVSPNRPDCLAVYGVARELHAVTEARLAEDPTAADAEPSAAGGVTPAGGVSLRHTPRSGTPRSDRAEDYAAVEIADPDICLRFTARVFEDVTIGPSPDWLKARLLAAGQRPISNVVDITNYVMLLSGQPLHAFDLDRVRGARLVIRRAEDGERMRTLDGEDRRFDPSVALVCDAEGPSGIAGIMGGEVSEVSGETTRVLMEVATWVGPNILETSLKLGLRTEASARFEKQLHPDWAMAAQRLSSRLMMELCGARLVPGTLDAYPRPVEPRVVKLRLARLGRLLGQTVEASEVEAMLDRLGFGVVAGEGEGVLSCTVPYWRDSDVQREADLIEEVARVHGLDSLPTTLPARRQAVGRLSPAQHSRRRLEDALRDRGLSETISYSFTSPAAIERLRLGHADLLRVANPLSEEQSVMRPLLLPGLLDAARHNSARDMPDLALFESAHVYEPGDGLGAPDGSPNGAKPARESHHLSALLTRAAPQTWRSERRPADFYAAKALLEGVLDAGGVGWRAEPAERPFLHPGRSAAAVLEDGRELGWVGEVHPLVARAWDLEQTAAAFEIDADLVAEAGGPSEYRDLTSFPAVRQDIAVVVGEDVPAAEVEAAVRAGAGDLLESADIFDVYRGDQVGEGKKSLALRLEFRAPDRTLTEDEVAELRKAIEAQLDKIGGTLRA